MAQTISLMVPAQSQIPAEGFCNVHKQKGAHGY